MQNSNDLNMSNNQSMTDLFNSYYDLDKDAPIIQLLNRNGEIVAALYLNKVETDRIVICDTNTSEKYAIYICGTLIYFTFFKKISYFN